MAGSLRGLAGTAGVRFADADVIAAFHQPLTPEQQVLDRYVFLPYARTGIAAALTTPFAWTGPSRAKVEMKVPVVDDRGPVDAEMTVNVYGPADVTEIDQAQVIRAFPKADTANAEVDDLVHVEFDRPDLPWLFTPAAPDAQGRLVPWLTLVVAERRTIQWGERRGAVRRASIRRDQLQPLGDAWAWAHSQVMGAKGADPDVQPTLEQRLSGTNAAHNLSRLVCPRRLDDHTAYVACVVPTFDVGRAAGLGLTAGNSLAPAWGTAADFTAGDPMVDVDLPVYFAWSFATGEDGNFESLAHQLKPRVAPPGVGRRRMDTTKPGLGDPEIRLDADDDGAEMVVTGPVVSPQLPENGPEEQWPTETQQQWDAPLREALATALNRPDTQVEDEDSPPVVGPPLYGGMHAQQRRVNAPAAPGQPQWFTELNLDPRHRVVGGIGTRVVQAEQEALMAAAWNQVVGIEQTNRALRLAQLAKTVSVRLHARHLARLPDAALVALTERVHAKVLAGPSPAQRTSVWAEIKVSSLPLTVTSGAFRRLTRFRGPVVRTAVRAAGVPVAAVAGLTVRTDRFTTDWVRTYAAPDGIRGLSAGARLRLTPEVVDRVAPGLDPDSLMTSWTDELGRSGLVEHLVPDRIDQIQAGSEFDVRPQSWTTQVRRALSMLPTVEEMFSSPDAAVTALPTGLLLSRLLGLAAEVGVDGLAVPRDDAERLGLDGEPGQDRAMVFVRVEAMTDLADRAVIAARELGVEDLPVEEYEHTADRAIRQVFEGSVLSSERVADGLRLIATRLVSDDPFVDHARDRVDVPALELVRKLDPQVTVPARIDGRLTSGSGRLPSWLRPDWFADARIEPVMAHPRFRWPMYEPLHRYDEEWVVPGLGLIQRPDMATLLETNNRFIEAYLIGLNHEMARELLWREFPTDQRGTYFDSFWTGRRELQADLHEAPWLAGGLGAHVAGADQRLVFLVRGDLVRRYPGVLAHAAREADSAGGVPIFEATSPVATLFRVFLPPNVLLVGFDMTRARIDTPGEKWWFTLSENPTEPRFGLDPSREGPITRDNLIWDDFGGTVPGQFLDASRSFPAAAFGDNVWARSSAEVAALLFQLPARAAFLGTRMVAEAVDG